MKRGHTTFAYIFEGSGYFDPGKRQPIGKENLVVYEDGDSVRITADDATQFLLASGKPINEPVAWRGPLTNIETELLLSSATHQKNQQKERTSDDG